MSELVHKKCLPCRVGTPPLKGEELRSLFLELAGGWRVVEERQIERKFSFKDFKSALSFVNQVGKVAEEEGHHPDIELGWGRVKITLFTHKIGGLSTSDFILAAKCDVIYAQDGVS